MKSLALISNDFSAFPLSSGEERLIPPFLFHKTSHSPLDKVVKYHVLTFLVRPCIFYLHFTRPHTNYHSKIVLVFVLVRRKIDEDSNVFN